MISNLLLQSKKLNKHDYTIVKEVLSKNEEELMNEIVDFWNHVEQEIEIRDARLKHWCGEGFLDA